MSRFYIVNKNTSFRPQSAALFKNNSAWSLKDSDANDASSSNIAAALYIPFTWPS